MANSEQTQKRYVMVPIADVVERQLPGWAEFDYADHYGAAIYRCDDEGNPVTIIGWDGGEPEDQTLYRDWSWVLTALNNEAEGKF